MKLNFPERKECDTIVISSIPLERYGTTLVFDPPLRVRVEKLGRFWFAEELDLDVFVQSTVKKDIERLVIGQLKDKYLFYKQIQNSYLKRVKEV